MELFLLITIMCVNIALFAIIFLSGSKNTINISFMGLLTFIIFWAIGDILMLFATNRDAADIGLYMFMIAPMFVSLSIVYFSHFFPNKKTLSTVDIAWIVIPALPTITLAGAILLDINNFVSFVSIHTPFNQYLVHAAYGSIYASYFTVYFLLYGSLLLKKFFGAKGIERKRIQYLMLALVVATVVAVYFNIMTPTSTHNLNTAWVGPLSSTLLIVATIFAILRYQLFDIKNVVFRLLAYFISLTIIILLFIILAFNAASIIFGGQFIPFDLQIYYVITAVIIALLFGPIKKLVDRTSNRLFFQQNYSAHGAVEKISNFSTRSVDAYSIQQHSLRVFEDTIRPEYAGFIMFGPDENLKLSTNIGKYPTKSLELSGFLSELSKIHHKTILADEVKNSRGHLKEYFELSHIGLITRLATNNKSIGYVVLGDKKNGKAYDTHDLQFLTLAANDLALALQNAQRYEEIQAFNETLQEKVNKATSALKRTNTKLVALDDIKDEFISMTSHQLRTPLTSVKGYISMMLEGDLGKINPTQRQALEEAFNSSQRMVFLISDFLNVSRIRTGKFTIERSKTDLGKIVTEEIAQSQDIAGLRGQTINYRASKDIPTVLLDEAKTRQVMMNLIDNAIYYTPKNGHIDISLSCTDKEIVFEVTDTGIGVPTGDQHRLFTKFFRAENARKARPDGTGLGLFMAQKIIDIQGGKIIFKSVENEGSTFGFRFPLKIVKAS